MTQKPSDVLPPPEIGNGDPEPNTVYAEVGKALSYWEGVENEIAGLFAVLIGDPEHLPSSPATRAYGTIATFRGRKEMVLAAAEAYFVSVKEKGLLAEIRSFLNACNDYAARRNEIAHGTVSQLSLLNDGSGIPGLDDQTWYLMPAHYNSNKRTLLPSNLDPLVARPGQSIDERAMEFMRDLLRKGLGKYKYNSKQIAYYGEGFGHLSERGRAISERLRELNNKLRASQQTPQQQ